MSVAINKTTQSLDLRKKNSEYKIYLPFLKIPLFIEWPSDRLIDR